MLSEEIIQKVKRELVIKEGACGICHLTLKMLSEHGGKAISKERPDGILAKLVNEEEEILGEGIDIVWPSAILKAQINSKMIPKVISRELEGVLTSEKDRKKVSKMYGYGRVISPAGTIMGIIWSEGGCVEIKREGIGVAALLYDGEGELISDAVTAFCPICAINIAASRDKNLFTAVWEKHKNLKNTGKLKCERDIENIVQWKRRRIFVNIEEDEEVIGSNFGCCISYATIRAEISAGLGSKAMNKAFKNYCDLCPLKCFWMDKSMGAMGNIILDRMGKVGIKENVSMDKYITAYLHDGDCEVGRGIGSLCSLSATVNAFFKYDAVKILKPPTAKGFPHK